MIPRTLIQLLISNFIISPKTLILCRHLCTFVCKSYKKCFYHVYVCSKRLCNCNRCSCSLSHAQFFIQVHNALNIIKTLCRKLRSTIEKLICIFFHYIVSLMERNFCYTNIRQNRNLATIYFRRFHFQNSITIITYQSNCTCFDHVQ